MVRYMAVALALVGAAFVGAPKAEAAGGMFGQQDNFDVIQKIEVPDEAKDAVPEEWTSGKGVELVRHSQTLFVLAGVYVEDKGYAIRTPGSDRYHQLTKDEIKELQELHVLPKPLKGDIAMMTYVFGYSLWIVIALVAAFYAVKAVLPKKTPSAPPPAPTA